MESARFSLCPILCPPRICCAYSRRRWKSHFRGLLEGAVNRVCLRVNVRGFLQTDHYNVYLVGIWLPYAEPLVRKTKWLKESGVRNPRVVLESAGYDSPAVNLVLEKQRGWNSAVEFTCEWLEKRTSYTAATLRNSYTRVFGRDVLSQMKCSFCDDPAEGEFWAYGNSVVHCKLHRADKLPTSEPDTLRDRLGRRWWRQKLNILCTISPSPKPA